jgi:hypothetical protein
MEIAFFSLTHVSFETINCMFFERGIPMSQDAGTPVLENVPPTQGDGLSSEGLCFKIIFCILNEGWYWCIWHPHQVEPCRVQPFARLSLSENCFFVASARPPSLLNFPPGKYAAEQQVPRCVEGILNKFEFHKLLSEK